MSLICSESRGRIRLATKPIRPKGPRIASTAEDRTRLLDRLETAVEQVRGHLYEMRRNLRRWSDVVGDSLPKTDALLATFDPAPDLVEQQYAQKLAFVALLGLVYQCE